MIRQVFRKEIVQTDMRVDCNGVMVDYGRLSDSFGYWFRISAETPYDDALAAVKEIVRIMTCQSEDHGARWCMADKEPQYIRDKIGIYHVFNVHFRIRDAG